jgi:hypothetical protein
VIIDRKDTEVDQQLHGIREKWGAPDSLIRVRREMFESSIVEQLGESKVIGRTELHGGDKLIDPDQLDHWEELWRQQEGKTRWPWVARKVGRERTWTLVYDPYGQAPERGVHGRLTRHAAAQRRAWRGTREEKDLLDNQVEELYRAGRSEEQIAGQLNVSRTTVHRSLQRVGYKL